MPAQAGIQDSLTLWNTGTPAFAGNDTSQMTVLIKVLPTGRQPPVQPPMIRAAIRIM